MNEAAASGRKYTTSSETRGDVVFGKFRWQQTRKPDNCQKDQQLMNLVTNFLIRYIIPHVPGGILKCFTKLISDSGDMFRAHPNYDGIPWYYKAMVDWIYIEPGKKAKQVRLPAIIRAFIDLSGVSAGVSIRIAVKAQNVRGGKLYALINSFTVVDADTECPNAMNGRYKVDQHGPQLCPTMYLVEASAIAAPTLGIRDIGDRVVGDEFLFLFRRRVEWPAAWDSMIQMCRNDPPSAESAYGGVPEPSPDDKNLVEVPMVPTAQVVKKPPKEEA
jgi:hypothetical protein